MNSGGNLYLEGGAVAADFTISAGGTLAIDGDYTLILPAEPRPPRYLLYVPTAGLSKARRLVARAGPLEDGIAAGERGDYWPKSIRGQTNVCVSERASDKLRRRTALAVMRDEIMAKLKATLLVQGNDISDSGQTLPPSSSLMVTFDATGTGTSNTSLAFLVLTDDTTVSIASDHSSAVIGGRNILGQLAETNNVLTKVTLDGSQAFLLGGQYANVPLGMAPTANFSDGVVTDIAVTATSPTTIASSLKLIDASATTGAVEIFAGASNTSGGGDFDNGASLNSNITITYTGLKIEGGSGQDFIENDAENGIVTDGNHSGDTIILGGAGERATLGAGANDAVIVGDTYLETPDYEAPGTTLGDTVKFGAAATAELTVSSGAKAGSTAGTSNIGQTNVLGAVAGMEIQFDLLQSGTIVNENAAVATAKSLTAAENAAVAALGQGGFVYFNYHHSEYIIGVNTAETSVSSISIDTVVHLVGVNDLTPTLGGNPSGILTLH